jgi:hypothetical protein
MVCFDMTKLFILGKHLRISCRAPDEHKKHPDCSSRPNGTIETSKIKNNLHFYCVTEEVGRDHMIVDNKKRPKTENGKIIAPLGKNRFQLFFILVELNDPGGPGSL